MANLQAILSIYLRVIILYFCNFIVINLPYDNNGGSSFTTICYIDSLQKNFSSLHFNYDFLLRCNKRN
ncbi:hypothetical protein RIR_jg39972.t1 [Rhizophagus irregularis DAOM 181602=DAOM 197198]|nr:hypothetical protein RIR_jg39972.t1 [Rhizophagus irregularis DAOM 181602=DAOM 197198]